MSSLRCHGFLLLQHSHSHYSDLTKLYFVNIVHLISLENARKAYIGPLAFILKPQSCAGFGIRGMPTIIAAPPPVPFFERPSRHVFYHESDIG